MRNVKNKNCKKMKISTLLYRLYIFFLLTLHRFCGLFPLKQRIIDR